MAKLKQGEQFTDPAGRTGVVNFDTATGEKLATGATTNIINASDLGTSITPLNIAPTIPNTNGTDFSSYIESIINSSQTSSDKAYEESKKASEDSTADFLKGLMDSSKIPSSIDYKAQDKAKKEVDRLNASILAENKANRDRIEEIKKNKTGLFGGAMEQEITRVNDQSLNRQADLAILKFTADNDYANASNIASRQLEQKLEASRIRLEGLKYIADNNKDIMDKNFQVAINERIRKEERAYDDKVRIETAMSNIKLEAAKNGADASTLAQIGEAKTVDEALQAAGSSLVTPTTDIVKLDNGNTMLIDKRTGRVIKNFGGGTSDGLDGLVLGASSDGSAEQLKGLVSIGALVGGFSSVNAQKMFLKNMTALANKGDEAGLAEKIVGQTLANIPDADLRKKASGGFLLSQQLTGLQKLLDAYEAKGGDTNIIKGNIQSLQQKLGLVGDPELANIGTQILNQLDNLARTRTGAVITESEEKLYARLLPSIGKVGELNRAVINGLKSSIMMDVENNLRYNLTSDGLSIIKATLPEIFDSYDGFAENFTDENIVKNSSPVDFFGFLNENLNKLNK